MYTLSDYKQISRKNNLKFFEKFIEQKKSYSKNKCKSLNSTSLFGAA